jgi:amino acid adenylation domain-containing protein
MVEESKCKFVIDSQELKKITKESASYSDKNCPNKSKSNNLIYVIFTSGSTGTPKGVMVENESVVNHIFNVKDIYDFTRDSSFLQFFNVGFDAAAEEIFTCLCFGGILCIRNAAEIDPSYVYNLLEKHKITHADFSTAFFTTLINNLPEAYSGNKLECCAIGGERLERVTIEKNIEAILKFTNKLYNVYGPTETTLTATYFDVFRFLKTPNKYNNIPIGKPYPNRTVYILDRNRHLQPMGAIGEIYIGGTGLARGYLNNVELTAQKFVDNPYTYGEKLYRTGDLGRKLPDGNIEFIGRKDEQVKFRGYRIELAEIERAFKSSPLIEDAIVLDVMSEEGERDLVAFLVSKNSLDIDEIKTLLSKKLPKYMIPHKYVRIENVPLTQNGKVNKTALLNNVDQKIILRLGVEKPIDRIEEQVASIWADVLGLKENDIGRKDSFFDLGGHSLKITKLASLIYKTLNIKIELRELFENHLLEDQANVLRLKERERFSEIKLIKKQTHYALSSAQKRILFLQELDLKNTAYNVPIVNYLGSTINKKQLDLSLRKLIDRHESLRTSFVKFNENTFQIINDQVEFNLEDHECSIGELDNFINSFVRPFDLSKAPLMRSALVKVKEHGYVWIIDIHHIISDGTSHAVLTDDFLALYNGTVLPNLSIQYKDFCGWQNEMIKKGDLNKQEAYWVNQFKEGVPKLNLPLDGPRPEIFSYKGETFRFSLGDDLTAKIRNFNNKNICTLQMTLLTVLNILIYKYSGQSDIVIGCGTAGRRHSDLEKIVGMFINSLAIRCFPEDTKTFMEFHREVASICLGAYENQDVQFEDLVETLKLQRNTSRNPLFDICLQVQNFEKSRANYSDLLELKDIPAGLSEWRPKTAKFDMSWFVFEKDKDTFINIEYYTEIFTESTIIRFSNQFKALLKIILEKPSIKISDINFIEDSEKKFIIQNFVQGEKIDYSFYTTLHAFVENQASCTPNALAVLDITGSISFKELNEQANRLANFLVNKIGIKVEDRVCVLQTRSKELIISILGILKAGGTYVPLDHDYPKDRLLYIIKDSDAEILITEKNLIELGNHLQWRSTSLKHLVCTNSWNVQKEEGVIKSELSRSELWDHIGESAKDEISGGGWISSYTGDYFSKLEMQEYADNVYLKLEGYLHNKIKVLEIGCSSGLTLLRIAPHVSVYHGTDISSSILANTMDMVKKRGITNVSLSHLPAHAINELTEENFDLIIINSVIQCFDGHNYLRNTLLKAIDKLKDDGLIFLGDIMDEEKRDDLLKDLSDFEKNNRGKSYKTKLDLSAELFISKNYLNDLIVDNIGIKEINFSNKISAVENELTRYRYDALLTINKKQEPSLKIKTKLQYDNNDIKLHDCKSNEYGVKGNNLAYIIYTSGSTGKPKGVMIEHTAIVNTINAQRDLFNANLGDRNLQFASASFDASISEMFVSISSGGTLYVINDESKKDAFLLEKYIRENAINIATFPPSYLSLINVKELRSLKTLITAGEVANIDYGMSFLENGVYCNAYGPTESAICATVFKLTKDSSLLFNSTPIGKPIPNTNLYILDTNQKIVPIGAVGEICLGGASLGRGYVNKTSLSLDRFIHSPFLENSKLYKTGDLGRWLPDGNIEFIGRNDDQVKIRGFRVELGEIERSIENHVDIENAVVLPLKDKENNNYLVAYIEKKKRVQLTPSLAEYFVYDEILYNSLTKDERRNQYYKRAFSRYLNDKIVLDIGTGPDAILSQFCINAGAKKVYSVEILEDTYLKAKKMITSLGLDDKIILIHGDIRKISLPEKVDYCVSEIVGAIGGSEGAAAIVNSSRRLLKNPSNMLPKRSLTKVAGVCLSDELHHFTFDEMGEYYAKKIFDQVGYKFDLRICVDNFPIDSIITNDQTFEDLDFTQPLNLEGRHEIFLKINKNSVITGLIVWLNLHIDELEVIDTLAHRYSWLPVYLPVFPEGISVDIGDYIKCNITRVLSDNGLNPDFVLDGTLFKQTNESIDFNYKSSNHEKKYQNSNFYKKLFINDKINVRNDLSPSSLQAFLSNSLPNYMIPTSVVFMSKLPISVSGKIDKQKLIRYGRFDRNKKINIVPASNDLERKLLAIWSEILFIKEENICITDNFFEVGGHSLKATQVISKIAIILKIKVNIQAIFKYPTIQNLAVYLQFIIDQSIIKKDKEGLIEIGL